MSAKMCVRCLMPGHLSHQCRQPNPVNYPDTAPAVKRICGTCQHAPLPLDDEPCDTCDRTNGRFSNWVPKEQA